MGSDEFLNPSLDYVIDMLRNGKLIEAIRRTLIYRSYSGKPYSMAALRRLLVFTLASFSSLRSLKRQFIHAKPIPWLHPSKQEIYFSNKRQIEKQQETEGHARSRILSQIAWHQSVGLDAHNQYAAHCSQEVSNPYLDKRIIDFALQIDPRMLVYQGRKEKELLRLAMRDLLPPSVANRNMRTDFGMSRSLDALLVTRAGPAEEWTLVENNIINREWLRDEIPKALNPDKPAPLDLVFLASAELFSRIHGVEN